MGISRAEWERKRCGADVEEKFERRRFERKKWGFLRNLGWRLCKRRAQSVGEKFEGPLRGWHLEKKKRKEKEKKKGLRGEVGKVFKEKQGEREKKKGLEWIFQKENQSHLKLRNTFQRLILLGYVSSYSQNSCLYEIPPSSCFRIFNVLLFGVDEKGHKLLC